MERPLDLARCLIHDGTVTHPRDIVRAMETLEGVAYRQIVDGEPMAEGKATLVKLMADQDTATILVNGCLFLNVLSFRYLNFSTDEKGDASFELVGDGMTLELTPVEEPESETERRAPTRLLEAEAYAPEPYMVLDDDDEDGL